MIWYLIIFGYAYHTAVKVPEPSRAVCIQQATAVGAWMSSTQNVKGPGTNAFCVEGLKDGGSGSNGKA